jgi:hypothetical protein
VNDVLIGLAAVAIGALFCLRGYVAMRTIIPLWALFGGFMFGAGLVASVGDDGFLRSAAAWIVGIAVGLLFASVAYLYFEVSVVVAMATAGFALGTGLLTALGVRWSWLVVLGGLAAGVLLALLAIASDLPAFLLIALTVLGGATTIVFGLMLLVGTLQTDELDDASTTELVDASWWWYAVYLAAVIAGFIAQSRLTASLRTSPRDQWAGARHAR